MWSPVPRPKVIRRPRLLENFNHLRRKVAKKRNPLEFKPENHYGNRYYGIRHSDITGYLEQQIPSHALAPVNINAGPATIYGRGKRGEETRPSTAPTAVPWFGRQSSDVSDWLRQIPPAHLGLDLDNAPLPHFPTKTSIVTDNKWQSKDFPPLPNTLWHYWAERPSSAPLPTAPNQVQFDTILEAIKRSRPKAKPSSESPEHGPPSDANIPTPRSARSNAESRPETPRVPGTPNQSRPCTAPGGKNSAPRTPQPGTPRAPETALQCCECGKRQAGGGSVTGGVAGKIVEADGSILCKACGCGRSPQVTPRTSTTKPPLPSPRSPKRPETPQSAACNKPIVEQCQGNGGNYTPRSGIGTPRQENQYNSPASSNAGTPRPQTPKTEEKKLGKCSKSQRPPTCPTPGKQRDDHRRSKTSVVPFHEIIRNSRTGPDFHGHRNSWASADEFRLMNPDSHATKVVWEDKFRKQQKGNPWPIGVH